MTADEAIEAASNELGLKPWYRPCVAPLLQNPEGVWPRCCGGGCEPCGQVLCAVAARALELLETPRQAPLP